MIHIRHIGVYVKDIEAEARFYKKCFSMIPICENYHDEGILFDQLLTYRGGKVIITKLVTTYGKEKGQGDMIELISVLGKETKEHERDICDIGMSHVAFGVEDIIKTRQMILELGGTSVTEIIQIGERKCSFCKDPEGNGIELIQ